MQIPKWVWYVLGALLAALLASALIGMGGAMARAKESARLLGEAKDSVTALHTNQVVPQWWR